jgi:hypothetical protein
MSARSINTRRVVLDGHVISWIGRYPKTETLCFGTDEGTFHVLPDTGTHGVSETGWDVVAGGAINGVAFDGDVMAFSSTSEFVLGTDAGRIPHSFIGGAHGVAALPQCGFIAALGDDGMLRLSLDAKHNVIARIARHASASLYFFKIVPLMRQTNIEFLVCAARQDGLLAITLENDGLKTTVICHHFSGHDIVDVCALNDPVRPRAVACLSRSRGLFIVPDVFSSEPPTELRIAELGGTAYSLVAAMDHLFLLTDKEFICLPHEVSRILSQAPIDRSLAVSTMPIAASEMFLIGRDLLALLADDGALLMDIEELIGTCTAESPHLAEGNIEQISLRTTSHLCTTERFDCQDRTLDLTLAEAVPV